MALGLGRTLLLLALAVNVAGAASSDPVSQPEPENSLDADWGVNYIPGTGWMPDIAINQAGTFIRYGNRLLYLDGPGVAAWNGVKRALWFGGLAPATVLGCTHLLIGATGSLGPVGLALAKLHIIYTWLWQIRNLGNNWQAGRSYLLGQFIGGIESHYSSGQVMNYGAELAVGLAMAEGGVGNFRRWLWGQMINTLSITPPQCLEDRVFIDLQSSDASVGGTTLRMQRIPRQLRQPDTGSCAGADSSWRQLLDAMDRLRIDRLTLKPDITDGRLQLWLHDHHGGGPGKLLLNVMFGESRVPWLEHQLSSGCTRFDVDEFRSLLHPVVIEEISAALNCMRTMAGDSEQYCSSGNLFRTGSSGREFIWSPALKQRAMPTWIQNRPGELVLFLGEHGSLPRLSWKDSRWHEGGGPALHLQYGNNTASDVKQYWLTRTSSYMLLAQADYIARYLPHMLARKSANWLIPGAGNEAGDEGASVSRRQVVDKPMADYAPGWLSNLVSLLSLLRRPSGG